ncbi:MAG: sugar transferase [Pseudomonadota bacterium]
MKYESAVENGATRTLVSGEATSRAYADNLPAGKRAVDIILATALFIFLSPIMLMIGVLIKLQDGGSMFFIQNRRGRGGEYFLCMKFRTMRPDAQEILKAILETNPEMAAEWEKNQKFQKDPRVTFFGQFLRRTSLDELPQLLNIIRGEMSVVGPRPIIEDEVARYGDLIEAYDAVRPGVTGLWQVSGRSDTTYEERVALDAEYASDVTVLRDFWILLRTIPAVLFARGAV